MLPILVILLASALCIALARFFYRAKPRPIPVRRRVKRTDPQHPTFI